MMSVYAYNCAYRNKKSRLCHTWRSIRFLFPNFPVPHFPVSHFQRPPRVALFCTFIVVLFLIVPLNTVSLSYCFFQAFISCTGGQSVSRMLLWQPSDCVHIALFSENKYDDDDDDDDHDRCEWVNVSSGTGSPRLSRTKSREP